MKLSYLSILILFLLMACLDDFKLKVSASSKLLVVDGMITNEPGPYIIKLYWSSNVGDILTQASPVSAATVTIADDQGFSEVLQDQGEGIYQTKTNGIQGQVGRTYHLEVSSPDGNHYASKPELLAAPGTLDSLFFQFIENESIQGGEAVPNNGFNIFVNATGNKGQSLLRWTWTGTFEVITHPELVTVPNTGIAGLPSYLAAPLPCSGYISTDLITIQKVNQCTCCRCWIEQHQRTPVLSNSQLIENYQGFNVAYIPANPVYFFDKYYFEVQQLSISQNTYQFWKLIQSQQSSATSLFQPPIAKVKGNIESTSGETQALGIFSACGIIRKSIWLSRKDIPYTFPDPLLIDDCTTLESSSTIQEPPFWQ